MQDSSKKHQKKQLPFQRQAGVRFYESNSMQLRHSSNSKSPIRLREDQLKKYLSHHDKAPCVIVGRKDLQTSLGRWFASGSSPRCPLIVVGE